ncbi:hypothetical protein [Ruficoccus sp. ZRK36]|uniref:hypothetical protein n=1 Tax=Ruficoccus sp. ZRK36 TaxID=2866311 RepID=UPI001C72A5B0|nr:hypothetical protein [Ruficoccus sp. ZRK36]QYY36861.1 hypothetical protein K0V07_05130 [Ruficoccus sp. ZRK36]
MADTARQTKSQVETGSTSATNSLEFVESTITNEIVLGLCGPIGAPIKDVSEAIKIEMESRGYQVKTYKVSNVIEILSDTLDPAPQHNPEFKSGSISARKSKLINTGNALREKHNKEFLAEHIISNIYEHRKKIGE